MEMINVGKIVNTHGIKGELRIKSNFEKKDIVFYPGNVLYLGEEKKEKKIITHRIHKNFNMVLFDEISNINEVLQYIGKDVFMKKTDLKLSDEEYLMEELIGFQIKEEDEILGKVEEILYNKSNALLTIKTPSEIIFYIPFVPNFIKKVEKENREIKTNHAKELIL